MPFHRLGSRVDREHRVHSPPAHIVERRRPQLRHHVPSYVSQQPLSKRLIGPEEKPVLRRNQSRRASSGAILQALLDEGGREIGQRGGVNVGDVVAQLLGLFTTGQIRHIGRDERELAGHQRRR